MHSPGAGPLSRSLRPGFSCVKACRLCVQMIVCSQGWRACVCTWRWDRAKEPQGVQTVLSCMCLSIHQWFGGRGSAVRRADSRPANIRSEGRRSFGGSQELCVWGWGWLGGGGALSLVAVPLPYPLYTPSKAGLLPP